MGKIFAVLAILFCGVFLAGCTSFDKTSKAGLQIITGDIGSTIFLNGQYLEKTPLIEKNLKPGTYSVRIQPDNSQFVAHELHVTLRKGLLTVITWKPGNSPETSSGVVYEMEPLKNKGDSELSFITIPDGAIIDVEGMGKDFSPLTVKDIQSGQRTFEVVLPSYETQKHTLNIVEGFRLLVNIKLAKLEGSGDGADSATATTTSVTGATPIASQSATLAPTGAVNPGVKIISTGYYVEGKEMLRVRATPSSAGTELGFAEVGQTYKHLPSEQKDWYQIEFPTKDGLGVQTGWVSANYSELVQ